ncbi:ABC transporter ATP-binding protein [Alicyclobacillus kakegawensis]|uniref:ABC transporter ATP-binding protein n=1 Tax=Alicyclobacillus kakegawensis TaxID=392012 RepID=UPI000A5E69D4|nr:ABC transporter ATP-binding protein [Alicyclobacillus kakegawensis]
MLHQTGPVIHCDHVVKRFYEDAQPGDSGVVRRGLWRRRKREVTAVAGISLDAQAGEVLGILGANGSGKSTLIRLISTLLLPDDGTIEVFGLDVTKHAREIRRRINRVSVEASFFKKLSALENLMFTGRLYGLGAQETRQRVHYILGRLGFSAAKVNATLESMSRGQQQKVAIARAFMTTPELLLLDEPTTGLDPKSRRDVQDFVEEIKARRETTIILTTHDMAEAERLCDRVAILDAGRLVALDTPQALKQQAGADVESFEDVFFAFVGREDWEEAMADEDLA